MTCPILGCGWPAGTACSTTGCPGRFKNSLAPSSPKAGVGEASGPFTGASPELILNNHEATNA